MRERETVPFVFGVSVNRKTRRFCSISSQRVTIDKKERAIQKKRERDYNVEGGGVWERRHGKRKEKNKKRIHCTFLCANDVERCGDRDRQAAIRVKGNDGKHKEQRGETEGRRRTGERLKGMKWESALEKTERERERAKLGKRQHSHSLRGEREWEGGKRAGRYSHRISI